MRARLVAQIAGQIASGYVARKDYDQRDRRVARWSVDLAMLIVDDVEERMQERRSDG